mmetsp:Transcript_13654/g.17982  ORF Transcript_13654/g.17982 Transcript_13654/m.17982 type:complete len:251 (+) Transcript_13654:36-788(+)
MSKRISYSYGTNFLTEWKDSLNLLEKDSEIKVYNENRWSERFSADSCDVPQSPQPQKPAKNYKLNGKLTDARFKEVYSNKKISKQKDEKPKVGDKRHETLEDITKYFVKLSKEERVAFPQHFPASRVVYPSEGLMDHASSLFPSHGVYHRAGTTLPEQVGGPVHPIFSTPIRGYQKDVQPRLGHLTQIYLEGYKAPRLQSEKGNLHDDNARAVTPLEEITAEILGLENHIKLNRLKKNVRASFVESDCVT